METLEDRVVEIIHEKFDALPAKSKPRIRDNGRNEWVPMSGIAVIKSVTSCVTDNDLIEK